MNLPFLPRELPLTPAALGSIAAVFVVAIGGYFGLVWPSSRQVTELEMQLQGLSAQAAAIAQPVEPVTDVERASWQVVEARVRDRFTAPDDQYQLLVEMAQLARSSGMAVLDVQLESATAMPGVPPPTVGTFPLPAPPALALNRGTIRLSTRHQFPALITYLDRLATANTYVAIQSLDVRRVENVLQSDIRLVSFRWAQGN